MWSNAVITNNGMSVLSQWMRGGSLTITKAKLGSGTVDTSAMSASTNVTGYIADAAIVGYKSVENGVQYTVRITPTATAQTAKQIGIFGKIGTDTEKLIALYQDATGVSIPSASEMSEFVYDFYAVVASDKGQNLTVEISTTAFATAGEVSDINEKLYGFAGISENYAYNASTQYSQGDIVLYNNSLFVAKTSISGRAPSHGLNSDPWGKITISQIAGKQDIISDLATIRSGSAAGATAVQPSALATKQDKLTASGGITIAGNVISARNVYAMSKTVTVSQGSNSTNFDFPYARFASAPHVTVSITTSPRTATSALADNVIDYLRVHVYAVTKDSCKVSVLNDTAGIADIGITIIAVL